MVYNSDMRLLRPVAAMLLFSALAYPSDDKTDRATLKGATPICVIVEVASAATGGGIGKDTLQTDMESRLQRAGIALDSKATACVLLDVRALQLMGAKGKPLDLYAADFRLELFQTVTLVRDNAAKTYVPTWSTTNLTIVPARELGATALDVTEGLIDRFIIAYKSVNP